jgi:hypothetical protein
MVRMTLGLLLVGYLTIDAVHPAGVGPSKMLLVLGYLLANLAVWFLGGPGFAYARWVYAALDFVFLLCPRHLFQFEALVDPNATMVGLFTLLLIAYTVYSDPGWASTSCATRRCRSACTGRTRCASSCC